MAAPASPPAPASAPPVEPPLTPAFVIKYGDMGTGKSVDDILSWAGVGLFLTQPGGLRAYRTVAAYPALHQSVVEVSTMEQVRDQIAPAAEAGWSALIVDDASLLMHNTMTQAEATFRVVSKNGGEGVDRAMWNYLRTVLADCAYKARWSGIHIVWNGHEQPGFTDPKTNERFKAGPDFAWKKLVKLAPHTADLLMRTITPDDRFKEWDTRADCCEADPNSYQKDRFDRAIPRSGPLNTAEILRAAGYVIPRPAELAWMDEVAQSVADWMAQGASEEQARAPWKSHLLAQGVALEHIRWALRDGVHRGRLLAHRRNSILASL